MACFDNAKHWQSWQVNSLKTWLKAGGIFDVMRHQKLCCIPVDHRDEGTKADACACKAANRHSLGTGSHGLSTRTAALSMRT